VLTNILFKTAVIAFVTTVVSSNSKQAVAEGYKCLYISSYHKGYAWSDGVEDGLKKTLGDKCEFMQFDMDTKRKKEASDVVSSTKRALDLINSWHPDVVITSDDNAAKHIIAPHFKNSDIPFVFSGVNWTVEEYGFPFANVTGIDKFLVSDFENWKEQYKQAQQSYDFLVIGSNSGIADWNEKIASRFAIDNSHKLSVTNMQWMMHVSTLGYTKIPSEHGEWAGDAAIAILDGMSASEIPIATNRKWELWINEDLESASFAKISDRVKKKAKRQASIE